MFSENHPYQSYHIVNSVCWSHALVNGPTSKRPASDGGLCSGQMLMMWSAVCSGSHAALSASPHFSMDLLAYMSLTTITLPVIKFAIFLAISTVQDKTCTQINMGDKIIQMNCVPPQSLGALY